MLRVIKGIVEVDISIYISDFRIKIVDACDVRKIQLSVHL